MKKTIASPTGGYSENMTAKEEADFLAQRTKDQAEEAKKKAEDDLRKAKEQDARAKLIANAGLTEDEADLILMKQ